MVNLTITSLQRKIILLKTIPILILITFSMKKQQLLLEELTVFEIAKKDLFERDKKHLSLGFCMIFSKPLQDYPRLIKHKPYYVHFDDNYKMWFNERHRSSYWFHPRDFISRNKILSTCIDEIEKELKSSFYGKILLFLQN